MARGSIQFLETIPTRAVWPSAARWLRSFRVSSGGNGFGDLAFILMKKTTTPPQQRHRGTEIQRNRATELQRYGGTAVQINRDTDDTDGTQGSALSASVKTLQEAVGLSLTGGLVQDVLFKYARALKAFEVTTKIRLAGPDLLSAFALWWRSAKPLLEPADDYDQWSMDFLRSFEQAKTALGSNSLLVAIERSGTGEEPMECGFFTNPKIRRLVSVCFHLQSLSGDEPFFISVRDAAKILETKNLYTASAALNGFVFHKILKVESKGKMHKATRYRYLATPKYPVIEESRL